MGVFEEEVRFRKLSVISDPQGKEGETNPVGWWILFRLHDMPGMSAGSMLVLDSRIDPPYSFGPSQQTELVFVDSGVLRIGAGQFEQGEVAHVTPRTDMDLRVSGDLVTYTAWQTNFYALWQRLRSLGLSDNEIAGEIAGGLRQQVLESGQFDVDEAFRTFLRANTAFRRLMRELHGVMTPFERKAL